MRVLACDVPGRFLSWTIQHAASELLAGFGVNKIDRAARCRRRSGGNDMSSIQDQTGIEPGFIRRDLFKIGGVTLAGLTLGVVPRGEAATPATDPPGMGCRAVEKQVYVAQGRDPVAYSIADNLFWNDIMMEHAKFF